MWPRREAQTILNGKTLNPGAGALGDGDFVTEELCQARRDGLSKDCHFHNERIRALERKQDAIDRKISATLVAVIGLCVTIIVFWIFGVNI